MAATLIFNKWDTDDVHVRDLGLARYMSLDTTVVPHTFGKKTRKRFEKATVSIVERLINKIMRSGQGKRKLSGKYIRDRKSTGKKLQAMEIVEHAFDKIEMDTHQNPIQLLVRAIENAAQREDITRMKKGGIAYTMAVDVAPQKRVDEALKNIALAGFSGSFKSKKQAHVALADEIVAAAKMDAKSVSVKRRDEVERIAKSSR
jgi:small subunit ribosomal protein S7